MKSSTVFENYRKFVPGPPQEDGGRLMSRIRWWILGLLFLSTTINYLDRTILAVLLPVIRSDFHIDESIYGMITASFQVAYMGGALAGGKLIDHFGTRIGLSVSAGIWSVAAVLHSSVTSPMQFGVWRAVLGFAEAANFPAANKAASEWFPPEKTNESD